MTLKKKKDLLFILKNLYLDFRWIGTTFILVILLNSYIFLVIFLIHDLGKHNLVNTF